MGGKLHCTFCGPKFLVKHDPFQPVIGLIVEKAQEEDLCTNLKI